MDYHQYPLGHLGKMTSRYEKMIKDGSEEHIGNFFSTYVLWFLFMCNASSLVFNIIY